MRIDIQISKCQHNYQNKIHCTNISHFKFKFLAHNTCFGCNFLHKQEKLEVMSTSVRNVTLFGKKKVAI